MIFKTSMRSLWQMKAILKVLRWLWLTRAQGDRLYVVCEEWFTNYLKYGNSEKCPTCWIRIQKYKTFFYITLINNGVAFNPFICQEGSVGLRLMTKLLKTKYRRFQKKNIFEINLSRICK